MTTLNKNITKVALFSLLMLFIGLGKSYGQFGMGNTLAPLPGNKYPIIYSNDAKGGHHQVATIADRDAIYTLRRLEGMLCTVIDDGNGKTVTYQLRGGILNSNWAVFISASATSGSFLDLLDKPTTLAGYGITDAMAITHAANAITTANITDWQANITNLATEAARATGAEGTLTTNLADEATERTNADALKEDLANKSTSFAADGGSNIKYPGMKSVKDYVDGSASSGSVALLTEVDRATNAETSENTDRIAADGVIEGNLLAENTARTSADATLTDDLATETAARIAGDAINANLTGDVTSIGNATTITDKAVTLSKMNDISTATFIGRKTAGAGSPEALTKAMVRQMLNISDSINFNTDRPITLSGTNTTGQNLGAGGKTMSQFLEAFFFPAVAATPPGKTFTTATTTFPYSTWKNWPSYTKNDLAFAWSVTNNSQADQTDDKLITSIKLKTGATELANAVPTGTSQSGNFTNITLQNTGVPTSDYTQTYTLEVIDAQPNTVLANILITLSKAIRLTYGAPTITPSTTAYEYDLNNKALTLNWSITPNDEAISSITVDGTATGSTAASGSQAVTFKTITNGGTQTKTYPLTVTGNIYGAGTAQNSPAVSWENRLYRGVITSGVIPSDGSFTFSDAQIKTDLTSENKLGGNWKSAAGYDFVCGAGGQYVVFAYPNDAVTPVVQYWDANFSTWMTYQASDLKIIDRANFVNQNGYNLTNYKLVFVCVQYISATVKIRLQ